MTCSGGFSTCCSGRGFPAQLVYRSLSCTRERWSAGPSTGAVRLPWSTTPWPRPAPPGLPRLRRWSTPIELSQLTAWAFTENVRRLGLISSMGTVGD